MKKKESFFKKKTSKISQLIIYLVIAIVIACALYTLYSMVIKATDIYTLEKGILYYEESKEGYVIRNEVVVQGENYKNGIIQIASEGERVAKEEQIFRYYSYTEEETVKEIEKINLELQNALSKETIISYPEIKLIEEQINKKTEELNYLKDVQEIEEYKKEINNLIYKKASVIGEKSKSGSYIKQLMDKKAEYERILSKNSEYIKSPIAGVMSYRVDELESILTPNCFNALTADYLNDLGLKSGKLVATNNEKGKVIDNFYCYIATVTNSDKAKEAEVGDNLKLRLPNEKEVAAQIAYINKSDENNIIVVFKINKFVESLIDYRKIDFDIIWWSESGFKVPNQSILTDDNGLKYVIRNRSGYLSEILVKVIASNETHSIIEAYDLDELKQLGYEDIMNYKKIALYDEIVLKPTWDMVEK